MEIHLYEIIFSTYDDMIHRIIRMLVRMIYYDYMIRTIYIVYILWCAPPRINNKLMVKIQLIYNPTNSKALMHVCKTDTI